MPRVGGATELGLAPVSRDLLAGMEGPPTSWETWNDLPTSGETWREPPTWKATRSSLSAKRSLGAVFLTEGRTSGSGRRVGIVTAVASPKARFVR